MWSRLDEKVDVVVINADLEECDVVRWSKLHIYGFQCGGDFGCEHISSIFDGTDEVVDEECLVVWFFDVVNIHSLSMPCGASAASRRRKWDFNF